MEVTAKMVKELRDKTGVGMMDCKAALKECEGDFEKSIDYLRKKGIASAAKKSSRAAKDGRVGSYIHMGGKIGVLLEINCETDFVAKTDEFQDLLKNLTMHIAAANPDYVRREEVPEDLLERERTIYLDQAKASGKPEKILDKIVEGKLNKFYQMICLLEQQYVKDTNMTVEEYVKAAIGKLGENIIVKRFTRYVLGE